jgi:hypothetical protein
MKYIPAGGERPIMETSQMDHNMSPEPESPQVTSKQPCVSGNVQRDPIPLKNLKGLLAEKEAC